MGTDLYSRMGGEISYPWQTLGTDGQSPENDYKHAGYFWHVRRDMACEANPAGLSAEPCIRAFRVLVHQHQTGRDATVQFHSYVFEGVTSDGGYFLMGGWADFGDLHSPEGTLIVNTPHNHDSGSCGGAGRHKQHSPPGGPNHQIWYGASLRYTDRCGPRGLSTISVSGEPFDATDPANPARHDDYTCWNPAPGADNTRCRTNGTLLRPHLIRFTVDFFRETLDPDGNGIVDFTGYADRYGRPLAGGNGCSAYSQDCSPLIIRGLRFGHFYFAAQSQTANGWRDYDIYFCNGVQCGARASGSRTSGWNQPVP
jgi:hypothetical protein